MKRVRIRWGWVVVGLITWCLAATYFHKSESETVDWVKVQQEHHKRIQEKIWGKPK